MPITFTIGSAGYDDLDNATGRKALAIDPGSEQHRVIRFHPPGAKGNLVIFDGREGATIIAVGRYIGPIATILSDYHTDKTAWAGTAVDIIDDNNQTYDRCTLVDCKRLSQPKPMGDGTNCFFDFIAVFNWDGTNTN
jgi:hypothetical protein